MGRYKKMKKIKEEVVSCKKCPLSQKRNLPVIGEGSHEAKIIFVGEAPGANEDRTGRPFCGRAGKILNELLESIDLPRKNVYIANILKCRPPANRDPKKEEIEACTPYLERQIKIIKPKVICPLGRHAMGFLMKKYGLSEKIKGISKLHGQKFEINTLFGKITLVPLYHPAVATYNPNMKSVLEEDFQLLKEFKK